MLEGLGARLKPLRQVKLTEKEDHGTWHRLGLANRHLGDFVAENERGILNVGLEANCNSVLGVLGGYRDRPTSGRSEWDWCSSTPTATYAGTTLSGMLGGMPVAISAGLCLRTCA
jgi:hypothetical protein